VTIGSQLDAATTLLAAAGVDARLVVQNRTVLNGTDDAITSQLRSLVTRLLRERPSRCAIDLDGSPGRPTLRVAVLDSTNPTSNGGRQ
jgi:hypothetical protein